MFLSPNTTSGTKPVDAEIIENFKMKYRHLLLNKLMSSNETSLGIQDCIKMITWKQSTKWITSVWKNVQSLVIQNNFKCVVVNRSSVEKMSH